MLPLSQCNQCETFLLQSFGACPYPKKSLIWVCFSLLPMCLSYIFLIYFSFSRKFKHLKVFVIMQLAYFFCYHLFKIILMGTHPQQSCKLGYGIPSSHMTMMTSFVMLRLKYSPRLWEKISWIAVLMMVGISRIELNYHTVAQVLVGVMVGVPFFLAFEYLWKLCLSVIPEEKTEDSIDLNEQIGQQGIGLENNNNQGSPQPSER